MRLTQTLPFVLIGLLMFGTAADACIMHAELHTADATYADVVVVGRIANYVIVPDAAARQGELDLSSSIKLSPDTRRGLKGRTGSVRDYARFDVVIDQVLRGKAAKTIRVTWDNSTFREPETMPSGPMLIALRDPRGAAPPLRGPSGAILANPEPGTLTVLQAPCASAFIFPSVSQEANEVRLLLGVRPIPLPEPPSYRGKLMRSPDWVRRPSGEEIARRYPEAAMRQGTEGVAKLRCTVGAPGTLRQCAVMSERPRGQGFGGAAMALSKYYRMRPQDRDGMPVEGAVVDIEVPFRLPR